MREVDSILNDTKEFVEAVEDFFGSQVCFACNPKKYKYIVFDELTKKVDFLYNYSVCKEWGYDYNYFI